MDVMNPTYQEVERALDHDLAKLTLTMVWARQNGYTVEPKLIETFGLSSHIVSLHLSDGETIADIEPCLQGGCEVIYDREHRRALGRAPILPIFGIDSPAH